MQIARYFGNEFLRPDLEKAKERIVNLVSLSLESSSGGDLQQQPAHTLGRVDAEKLGRLPA